MKCDLCGKSALFGNNVSHSKRHTRRRWMPNIHPVTIIVDGQPKRLNLCTRCLRNQHRTPKKIPISLGEPVSSPEPSL